MKKIILFLFLSVSIVFGTSSTNINNTDSIKQNIIYLSYEKSPQRVYVNQIFKIQIKAIVATSDFDKIITNFDNAENVKILNPNNSWKWYNDNIYYNTFYIKATSDMSVFPNISVSLISNGKIIANSSLKAINPQIIKLPTTPLFCGVIASDMKIIKYKTTKFNNKTNMLVMEIDGKNANLRDFKSSNVIKDGIDSYEINLPNTKIFYFAIIDNNMQKFEFSYFNINSNNFIKLSVPIEVDSENISTQLALNPKASKLAMYENITLAFIAIMLLVIFFFRRKIIYILIFVSIAIYLFMFYNPFDNIILKKNTKIMILPTYNSIVFYVTDRKMVVQELNTIKGYIKIQLPNGKIGWIKKGE